MPSYLTPGVYVEEVPSGSGSLSAGATAIAAFVGFTEKAPKDDPTDPDGLKPRLVTNWAQFESLYGGFVPGAMLPHSVYGWFLNGGSVCYIVRVPHNRPSEESGQMALPAADRALGQVLEFESIGPADGITVGVSNGSPIDVDGGDPIPTIDLEVIKDGAVVESYEGLTLSSGDTNIETALAESQHVKVATKVDITDDLDLNLAQPKPGLVPNCPCTT